MGFSPAHRIELNFARSIERIVRNYLEHPTQTLEEFAEFVSRRMVLEVSLSNARAWRERAGNRGRQIYTALRRELNSGVGLKVRELVTRNAQQITSIPNDVRESLLLEIATLQQRGERPESIEKVIRQRIPELTRNKARLVARTETMKAASALTRARSEDLGIDWYAWATAEDQRVRPSHRLLDKVLVNWSNPPNPEGLEHVSSKLGHYHAGNAPNCRCVAIPVVSLTQVAWPARVYWNQGITRMTMAQFTDLTGIQRRAA